MNLLAFLGRMGFMLDLLLRRAARAVAGRIADDLRELAFEDGPISQCDGFPCAPTGVVG